MQGRGVAGLGRRKGPPILARLGIRAQCDVRSTGASSSTRASSAARGLSRSAADRACERAKGTAIAKHRLESLLVWLFVGPKFSPNMFRQPIQYSSVGQTGGFYDLGRFFCLLSHTGSASIAPRCTERQRNPLDQAVTGRLAHNAFRFVPVRLGRIRE